MNIEIEIKETKDGCTANIKADFSLSFESMKDAKEWAEVCKSDIENLAKECDCPKCRAEKEAEATKPEPEGKRPIAELEGLKVGDAVYAIRNNGNVHEYFISANYDNTFWIESNSVKFPIGIDGVPLHFGNGKQMFWRTKERAERFGK